MMTTSTTELETFSQTAMPGSASMHWIQSFPASSKRSVNGRRHWLAALAVLVLSLAPHAAANPASVSAVIPSPGATVNQSAITVTFTDSVTGVAPDDLFFNGTASANVSGSGTTYTYSLPPLPEGVVQAVWNPLHGIHFTSNGSRLNDLNATVTWEWTVVDSIAPTVLDISPASGATIGQMTRVLVTFSEPVTGVDAADLRINDQSANSVSGAGAGPYAFQVNPPAPGEVQVTWLPNHGIRDLAAGANVFDGAGWSYSYQPGEFAGDVVINEFMTAQQDANGLRDEDGDLEDWIELHNRGSAAVNLQGWSLADDDDLVDQWVFPAVTIGPGDYLVVFASGKNRKPTDGSPLHTNFKLGASGQHLALFNANEPPEVATRFLPGYPPQRGDIAYGLFGGAFVYLTNATPGAANSGAASFSGFAEPPAASVKSGFFSAPFVVSLSTETAQATIRYTLDGSEPTHNTGMLYTGPITITPLPSKPTVNLRAVAFRDGMLCSRVSTYSYVFPAAVLQQPTAPPALPANWVTPDGSISVSADYEMDPQVLGSGTNSTTAERAMTSLPALSIVLEDEALFSQQSGIYANPNPPPAQRAAWERSASAELIFPDGQPGFRIDAGLRIQGGTSRDPNRTRKHSMRLFFNKRHDGKLEHQVFSDSPRTRFNSLVVDAGSNLTWHNRLDSYGYRAQYIRDQFCSDLQLAAGSPAPHGRFVNLFLNGLYWGVYYLHERPDEEFAAAYFGGDDSEYDVVRNTEGALEIVSGDADAWHAMMSLVNSGLSGSAQYQQLRQYLDIDRFIDYMILNIWAGNTDWSMHNWYASRRRAPGAGFIFQMWDAEYTLISQTENVSGYNHTGTPTSIHSFLRNNPEYRQRFADRLHRLCFNGGPLYVNPEAPDVSVAAPLNNRPGALYMQRANEVDLAMVLESARWGDAAPGREDNPFTRDVEFLNELNWLKSSYFPNRTAVVLEQFRNQLLYPGAYATPAPAFNLASGNVTAGAQLAMTAPLGTIYYTTNGSDPRVEITGEVAPGALVYSGSPLTLDCSVTVKARALNGAKWSPLNEATFSVAELLVPLRITELMYDPAGGDAFEYLEIQNIGATPVDMSGYSLDGVTFSFPAGFVLQPGAVAILASAASPLDWAARYPDVTVAGYYDAKLSNSGERVALKDSEGRTIVSVDYSSSNGWPDTTGGYAIEIMDVNGDPDDPANWRRGGTVAGTPGTIPAAPSLPALRLNEVMALNSSAFPHAGTFPDWVELHNAGSQSINLAGWSLTDGGDPRKFVFPDTTIPAGGYLLVFCDSEFTAPGLHAGFALAGGGETIALYDPQTNRVDAVTFGPQIADHSIGRLTGEWQLTQPTPLAANQSAALGSPAGLRINEWLANSSPGQPDWFEIYNSSSLPVALRGLYAGTANALFQIGALSFIDAGGYLQMFADEAAGADHVDFKLPATGNFIALYDQSGTELDRVSYGAQTEAVSEGRYPDGSSTLLVFAGSASPGGANFLLTSSGPRLNEIMASNQGAVTDPWGGSADWIEIRNAGSSAMSLAGMSLSVGTAVPGQWNFPSVNLAAGGHMVIWCDGSRPATANASGPLNLGQSLPATSGAAYLFNAAGQVVDLVEYGSQIADQPIGRSGDAWKLLAAPTPAAANSTAATLGPIANVRFNEWMAAPIKGEDWFELYNTGTLPVELSGLYLTDDPSIAGQTQFTVPPLSFLPARGWLQFIADGDPAAGRNHVNFKLGAAGETLRLYGTNLVLIDSVAFWQQQPGVSQGRLPDGATDIVEFPASATPGGGNYLPLESIVINEVLTHTDSPLEDAIELLNVSGQPIDLSGWYLSDSEQTLEKFQIPPGTTLAPGEFKVFYQYQFHPAPGSQTSFALDSAHGDAVYLSQANANGLTGYRTGVTFGAAVNGVSFGRFQNSTGVEFVALSQRTFGQDAPGTLSEFRTGTGKVNAYPKVGPVVINELMYRPVSDDATFTENPDEEFIELLNASSSAVPLHDPALPANRWRLSGGVEFIFPDGVTLPAQGLALVVRFDPTANPTQLASFRARYNVPSTVPVYGPFSGRLSNDGESIELLKPDAPQGPGPDAGFVPYVLVERVHYQPVAPWPSSADGGGASLQRHDPAGYGNDPLNWNALAPSAGLANETAVQAPVIVNQPKSQVTAIGTPVKFEVEAAGLSPLSFQWQRDGVNIATATNATVNLSPAPNDSGSYRVRVSNPVGAVWSQPATLLVAEPPEIMEQPASRSAQLGETVTFEVGVSGTAPFSFQWYVNGQPCSTNSTLTLPSVDSNAEGTYWVVVSNSVGVAESQPANLLVGVVDSDGDGLPDDWELANNLDRFNADDALLDSDNDGMSNHDEWIASTNPQDPQSVLRLDAANVEAVNGYPRFSFTAMANVGYTIQASSAPVNGVWSNIGHIQPDPATRRLEVTDPAPPDPVRYYRVVTPIQP